MSFKSSIKSKRQKLDQKKFSKGFGSHLIDLVESSEEQHYRSPERIQKRSKFSGRPINSKQTNEQPKPYVPRVMDLARVQNAIVENKRLAEKILYTSSKDNQDYEGILVVQIAEQQNPDINSRQRSLFSYRIEGKQGIKYISETHMKGRVTTELNEIKSKQIKKLQKEELEIERILQGSFMSEDEINLKKKKDQKNNEQKQNEQPAERKRAARYFEELESDDDGVQEMVKCFRCYKRGHIAKNCIEQEPKQSCNFCLLQHHHSVCDSSPCFRCCLPGHISQDCQSKAIECRKCRKRGHKSEKCGVYLPLDYHNKNQDYIKDRFKKTDLKRLKCLRNCKNPTGHFNCFSYESTKDLHPYSNPNPKRTYFERENQRYRR